MKSIFTWLNQTVDTVFENEDVSKTTVKKIAREYAKRLTKAKDKEILRLECKVQQCEEQITNLMSASIYENRSEGNEQSNAKDILTAL